MKKLTAILCLSIAVLLGSAGEGWSGDLETCDRLNRVDKDPAAALKCYAPLAEQGHAMAQYRIAFFTFAGWGTPKDYAYAYMWASISAVQNTGADALMSMIEDFSPGSVVEGQKLAREYVKKNYKGC